MATDGITRCDGKVSYHGTVLPPGPWHDEPDRVEFKAQGFSCLLLRGPVGAWCGYVGVPPGHPWHGKDYSDVRITDGSDDSWPDVHGGLTYAAACNGHICHEPKGGEPEDLWWLGFDCSHAGDLAFYHIAGIPGLPRRRGRTQIWPDGDGYFRDSYKPVAYVRAETEKLAAQARKESP